ncbi:hypothetical protein [Shimia sp.]|uniref:hypothetical protein n=1 Tax=Shimia sp. TaxID=1954381 RepID=UPI003B8DE884
MNISAILRALVTASAFALISFMAVVSLSSDPVPDGHIVKLPPFGPDVDQTRNTKLVTLGEPEFYKLH